MYEVLAYVIESFQNLDACPKNDILRRRLNAAGFEADEVQTALIWLSDLRKMRHKTQVRVESEHARRILSPQEQAHLPLDCQDFFYYIDNNHGLAPLERELVLERAMSIDAEDLDLDLFRLTVIAVLWSLSSEVDIWLGELLMNSAEDLEFPLH